MKHWHGIASVAGGEAWRCTDPDCPMTNPGDDLVTIKVPWVAPASSEPQPRTADTAASL